MPETVGTSGQQSRTDAISLRDLKIARSNSGQPLYLTVRDVLHQAIDAGAFPVGRKLPSTKHLSQQLEVSLVTAHRALQELVASGVLKRAQGKGTFVRASYLENRRTRLRVGVVYVLDTLLMDSAQMQVITVMHQAVGPLGGEVVLTQWGEDLCNECRGLLLLEPLAEQLDSLTAKLRGKSVVLVGTEPALRRIPSICIDNHDLARQAVDHLATLGHRRIGYLGCALNLPSQRHRWEGFLQACQQRQVGPAPHHVIHALNARLDQRERLALVRMLGGHDRPTAIFAASFELAMSVYGAAVELGLRVPHHLSVVGVDDPPAASHLTPPLTTLRLPLTQLAEQAVQMLFEQIHYKDSKVNDRTLVAELVIRSSTGVCRSE